MGSTPPACAFSLFISKIHTFPRLFYGFSRFSAEFSFLEKLKGREILFLLMEPISISEIVEIIEYENVQPLEDKLLYVFGRNPELSLAELISCYNAKNESINASDITKNGALVALNKEDGKENNKSLSSINLKIQGSLLKRAQPILFISNEVLDVSQINPKGLVKELYPYFNQNVFMEEKSYWGLSIYNTNRNGDWKEIYNLFQDSIKKTIKKIKIKRAYFRKPLENYQTSPIQMQKKEIIQSGFEIILWLHKDGLIVARTEDVIDIEDYDNRDKKRPQRRPLFQIGLALARSMINLVSLEQDNHDKTIYDPFCGIGTIPEEAFLMGLNALGSDVDNECIGFSHQNLKVYEKWANQKERQVWAGQGADSVNEPESPYFFKMDISNPKDSRIKDFNGCIVTEPDLLEPLTDYPSYAYAKDLREKFIRNYHNYLRGLTQILHVGQYAVMVFPKIHMENDERLGLPLEHILEEHGFELSYYSLNNLKVVGVFVHSWKDPFIEREIAVFKKVKKDKTLR